MHDLTEIMHKAPQVPLRVDAALRLEFPTGHDVRPHQHQTWELVYFLEGDARCPTGDGVVEGHPGTLLLTPPRLHLLQSGRRDIKKGAAREDGSQGLLLPLIRSGS